MVAAAAQVPEAREDLIPSITPSPFYVRFVTATFCHSWRAIGSPIQDRLRSFFMDVVTAQRRGDLRVAQLHTHARQKRAPPGRRLASPLRSTPRCGLSIKCILGELILPADAALQNLSQKVTFKLRKATMAYVQREPCCCFSRAAGTRPISGLRQAERHFAIV